MAKKSFLVTLIESSRSHERAAPLGPLLIPVVYVSLQIGTVGSGTLLQPVYGSFIPIAPVNHYRLYNSASRRIPKESASGRHHYVWQGGTLDLTSMAGPYQRASGPGQEEVT